MRISANQLPSILARPLLLALALGASACTPGDDAERASEASATAGTEEGPAPTQALAAEALGHWRIDVEATLETNTFETDVLRELSATAWEATQIEITGTEYAMRTTLLGEVHQSRHPVSFARTDEGAIELRVRAEGVEELATFTPNGADRGTLLASSGETIALIRVEADEAAAEPIAAEPAEPELDEVELIEAELVAVEPSEAEQPGESE